jgi:site-specific DNA-methyltransferase (adenine-specific)
MAKIRDLEHSDHWETPPELFADLNREFNFDFDPCPLFADFDGLSMEWGQRNFVNPPYERYAKEGFIKKAIIEAKKGKLCVCLIPVSTSTNLFHKHILPNAKDIRFLKGRIKFRGYNTKGEYVDENVPRVSAMHDSMIVIFGEHNG